MLLLISSYVCIYIYTPVSIHIDSYMCMHIYMHEFQEKSGMTEQWWDLPEESLYWTVESCSSWVMWLKGRGHVCGLKDRPVLSSQSFHAFMKKKNLFFLLNSFLFKSDTKNCRPIYVIVSFRDHIVVFLVQLSEDLELLQDGRVLLFLIRAFKHREISWRSCLFWLLCYKEGFVHKECI